MKPASFIVFFLVVAAVTAPGAYCENPAVLDKEGNPVIPKHEYIIEPIEGEAGVRVTHSNRFPVLQCPQVAVLSRSSYARVVFSPHSATNYVPVSTDLSIKFLSEYWPCEESKVWRVDPTSPVGQADISTDGFIGGVDSTFKIEKVGANYKFVYCSSTFYGCADIGVFVGPDGKEHLGLNRAPLTVRFKPVKDSQKSC